MQFALPLACYPVSRDEAALTDQWLMRRLLGLGHTEWGVVNVTQYRLGQKACV